MSELVVAIEDAKLWLRVESSDEDSLILSFIQAAEDIVEGILRFPLSEFEIVPETVANAICFIVSNFYEKRESFESEKVIETAKHLLFPYRREVF